MEKLFMKAWAAFAEDPANGLTDMLGWPTYDPKGEFSRLMATLRE